jgi:hypothetical protein
MGYHIPDASTDESWSMTASGKKNRFSAVTLEDQIPSSAITLIQPCELDEMHVSMVGDTARPGYEL